MKILALEKEVPGVQLEQFQPYGIEEAARVWSLYQQGILREIYFNGETHEAVLVLECTDRQEAEALLATLPLVIAGLITFEVLPLIPYSGFARLFDPDLPSVEETS
jgi:muconolactone delta-isomerase